ncbi:hypothetical protein OG474_41125 [Kribbella sp. NBC_01505]|uniref:hypothetical protein n=1 Tax=Kribbella sp. NBC_01505 TaxID=2903580 RepID=UPI003862DFE3
MAATVAIGVTATTTWPAADSLAATAQSGCPLPGDTAIFYTITPESDASALLKRQISGQFSVTRGSKWDGVSGDERWRLHPAIDDLGQPLCEGTDPVVYIENVEIKAGFDEFYHLDTENNGHFAWYHGAPGTSAPDTSSSQHWVMHPLDALGGYTFRNRSLEMPENARYLNYDQAGGNFPFVMGGGSSRLTLRQLPT